MEEKTKVTKTLETSFLVQPWTSVLAISVHTFIILGEVTFIFTSKLSGLDQICPTIGLFKTCLRSVITLGSTLIIGDEKAMKTNTHLTASGVTSILLLPFCPHPNDCLSEELHIDLEESQPLYQHIIQAALRHCCAAIADVTTKYNCMFVKTRGHR